MTTLRSPAGDSAPSVPEPASRTTLEPAAAPAPTRAPGKRRDPWFDNIKMLLVVLVVVGHTWSQLPETPVVLWAYDFLYSWHMPAFVVVTGYLSRSMTWERARLRSLVTTLLVPYVLFESALTAVHVRFGGAEVNDFLFVPHSPMWFLLALIGWRLVTPVFLRLPRAAALGLAVALSLLVGFVSAEPLALDSATGFLPFFVLGLHARREDWDALRRFVTVPRALAYFAALLVFSRYTDTFFATSWFHYDTPYAEFGNGPVDGVLTRLAVLALGLAGSVAFFALVPRRHSWLTVLGASTMVVYLFHDFVVLAMTYSGYPDWSGAGSVPAVLVASGVSVLVGLALATPPVTRVLGPLTDPVGFFERRRNPAPRSG